MRWFKRLGLGIVGLIALVLTVLLVAWVFLQTPVGGRVARDQALAVVNDLILGKLELETFSLTGSTVTLDGIVLRDPDEEVVVRVDRFLLNPGLASLFTRTVRVDELRIENPEFNFVSDASGSSNLQRAIELREPSPPKEEEPPSGDGLPVHLALDAFVLRNGVIRVESPDPTAPTNLVLDALNVDVRAYVSRALEADGEVRLGGMFLRPTVGVLDGKIDLATLDGKTMVRAALQALDVRVKANASLEDEGERLVAVLEELSAPPASVRAFLPTWPLQVPVVVEARVKKESQELDFGTVVRAGKGRVVVDGKANLERMTTPGISVVGAHLDLAELAAKAPRSDIAFRVDARGGGTSLQTADATVSLDVPESQLEKAKFGPIRIRANAAGGRASVDELLVQLPGLLLTAQGDASQKRIAVHGKLQAEDLARLGQTVGRLVTPEGLPLQGKGGLEFQVSGSLDAPAVRAGGRFERLGQADLVASGIAIDVGVPNVLSPFTGDATVGVSAEALDLGERKFRKVYARVDSLSRRLNLSAGTRGAATVDLTSQGTLDPKGTTLTLSSMSLRYPEAHWRLMRPATIAFGTPTKRIQDFDLRAEASRLAVDAHVEPSQRFEAALEIAALDLSSLPKALLDPSWNLGGTIDAKVKAKGTTRRPLVDAELHASHVNFQNYKDLNADLNVKWDGKRADGDVNARGLGAKLEGTFGVPVQELLSGGSSKIAVDLTLDQVPVEKVLAELDQKVPLKGLLSAKIQMGGTANAPSLDTKITLEKMAYESMAFDRLDVIAATDPKGQVAASVLVETEGRESRVALDTPFTLTRLIRKPPTGRQVLSAPLALTMKLRDLPIPVAELMAGSGPTMQGKPPPKKKAILAGDLKVAGPLLHPTGGGELTVRELVLGNSGVLGAKLTVALAPKNHSIEIAASRGERSIVRAVARLQEEIESLMKSEGYVRAPWQLDVDWGPVTVSELQTWFPREPELGQDPFPILQGVTRGKIRARGPLTDPNAFVDASVHGLGSGSTPTVGDLSFRYRYQKAKNRVEADLMSTGGGSLDLRAETPLDLSWGALKSKKTDWRKSDLKASLRSRGFDPGFLAAVTPMVRRMSGKLNSDVRVKGTLSLPNISGKLEFKDGFVELNGMGEYRELHAKLSGDDKRIQLEDFSGRSGNKGKLKVTGDFRREGQKVALKMNARLDEFPIVTDDQLMASLSLRSEISGKAAAERIDALVKIDEAQFLLPDQSPASVQPLGPQENVTFVFNGEPLKGQKDPKKEAALEEAKAQAARDKATTAAKGTGGSGPMAEVDTGPSRRIEIRVDAPRNLWAKGKDLNVEVGLLEGFRVIMVDEAQVFGEVQTLRGTLDVLGRRFEFDRNSRVTFGGAILRPQLNVAPVHENEKEGVIVTMRVTGIPPDIAITPTSDPPLSETEIYTLIATGRRSIQAGGSGGGGGGGAAGAATSLVGSLAAAQLKQQIGNVVPLDVLEIQAGEGGVKGTRVEAGKYITDDLYLGVERNSGARPEMLENRNQLNLEYELWRYWMFDFAYGDARKGKADLIWRKRY